MLESRRGGVTIWLVRLGVLAFLATTWCVAGAHAVVSPSDIEVPAPLCETLAADDADEARAARLAPPAAAGAPPFAAPGDLTPRRLPHVIFQPPEAG